MKKFLLIFCLFLGSCQLSMKLPELEETDTLPSLPSVYKQRPIAFEKAVIDLPRGQTYIAYPYWRWSFDNVDIGLLESCNSTSRNRFANSTADWAMGEKKFGSWQDEAAEFFNTPLKEMGYDVVDAFGTTFKRSREKRRAELLISARITDIKSNQCNLFNAILLKNEALIGGDAYIQVEWEIYDTLADKVIATLTTSGIGVVNKPTEKGNELILLRALQNAAERLGYEKDFYRLVTQQEILDDLIKAEAKQKPFVLEMRRKQNTRPLRENYFLTKRATLTVGEDASGFYITNEGHILTTAEAVGSARHVVIKDARGGRFQADVLRTNFRLNVALLKGADHKTYSLPIAEENILKPLTKVFVIGNPEGGQARATITEGIISNNRFQKKKNQNFIQASITTTSGYAGAPLVDEFGNVLGLHDGRNDQESAFSYFIPIHDALRALNIQFSKKPLAF
ncbi:MAG: serine protease [Alphaproteobacteria bacterium]